MSTDPVYWPFDVLGFTEIPTEKRDVKRAYAKRLKQIDQSADPQGFQDLREAYEAAIGEIDYIAESQNAPPPPVQVTIPTPVDPQPVQPTDFTPPVLPAAPEPDENQVDWARVHELCAEIEKPNNTEKNVERFRRIINDPVFQDIDAAHELERTIYNYATSMLQYIDGHTEFAPQIYDVLEILDERFGWYSDSVAFQKRFYASPHFMGAIAYKLAPVGEFKAPTPKNKSTTIFIKIIAYYLSTTAFWIIWGTMIIPIALFLPQPYDNYGALIIISIPTFVFLSFITINVLTTHRRK